MDTGNVDNRNLKLCIVNYIHGENALWSHISCTMEQGDGGFKPLGPAGTCYIK